MKILHGIIRSQLKECLDNVFFVPSWLTKGRTALLQKDKSKGNQKNRKDAGKYLEGEMIYFILTGQ